MAVKIQIVDASNQPIEPAPSRPIDELISTSSGPNIHILQEAPDDSVQVWVNTQDCEQEGTIIGLGGTRQEAVESALSSLEEMAVLLRQEPK